VFTSNENIEQICLKAKRRRARKICDQVTESSNGARYFLIPVQNMVAATKMLRSILEPDEPEAKEMYWNLRNLVERVTVQQAKVDRWQRTDTESRGTHTTLSWSKGALASQSTPTHIHIKHRIGGIHDACTSSIIGVGNMKNSSNRAKQGARAARVHLGRDHTPLGVKSERRSSSRRYACQLTFPRMMVP
jgi:hypothetical protein